MDCLVCGQPTVREQLDAGHHPVASFFQEEAGAAEHKVHLALGQCGTCGTVQSTDIVSHEALIPPHEWIPAREPEDHLDEVVDRIMSMIDLGADSTVAALTYKDDTTVDRFAARGVGNTWRIDPAADLGIDNPNASIETIQARTNPENLARIAEQRGKADLFIVRHILEHAENLADFVRGCAQMVKPGGMVMFEVPDCAASLKLNDYCMIWEEHSLYLTPATFAQIPALGGFETKRLDVFPLPFENSLVCLAVKTGEPGEVTPTEEARAEIGLLKSYADAYEPAKRDLRAHLEKVRSEEGPIALFGAGHLAHAFANFMDVADLFDFVADDTPRKQGKRLAGTGLEVLPSQALAERKVALCLLALSIKNEDAVIARNQDFVDAGGRFASIFRSSPRSIFSKM